ncbi:MAG: hypothetical protein DWI57_00090 [Chloroflexi bacterium]|nr:MAG: hypothetical protein DWI57_00090 [Chloroflexota bacterium]
MTIENKSRILAFLSYLLLVVGAVYVLLFHRKDEFAAFHARQSLVLVAAAILAPAVWYAIAWLVMWIPGVGGPLGLGLFSGVLAAYLAVIFGWLRGLVDSLAAQQRAVPFFGGWTRYLPL